MALPAPKADSSLLEPGSLVAGKYEIVRLLGRGGMGVVYEAQHRRLNHRVAIKMLGADVSEVPDVLKRFEQEARAAVQLRGPHVAHVHDVDSLPDGTPFIVMEYLEGHDLACELAIVKTLPVGEAVSYLLDACAGMTEAHARGIVHRDLKPANLFLAKSAEGTIVKILDFGISKLQKEQAAIITSTQAVLGSPAYMSPEQVRSSTQVDHRSDIWSLGVILYEMLSGELPFDGVTPSAVIAAIVTNEPRPLAKACSGLPEPLADAVMKALRRDPIERFADVEEFARAIEPYKGEVRVRKMTTPVRPPEISKSAATLPAPILFEDHPLVSNTPTTDEPRDPPPPSSVTKRPASTLWPLVAIAGTLTIGFAVAAATRHDAAPTRPGSAAAARPTASIAAEPDASSPIASVAPVVREPSAEIAPSASIATAIVDSARPAREARDVPRPPPPVVSAVATVPPSDPVAPAGTGRRIFRTSF